MTTHNINFASFIPNAVCKVSDSNGDCKSDLCHFVDMIHIDIHAYDYQGDFKQLSAFKPYRRSK